MTIGSFADLSTPKSTLAKEIAQRSTDKRAKGTGIKDIMEGRSDVFKINPYDIKVKAGFNSREFIGPDIEAHIEMLAHSIEKVGVRRPLVVFREGEDFYLEDGECRLRATYYAIETLGAAIRAIPVQVSDRAATAADRILSQIILNSGKELTPLEQCTAIRKLLDYGWSLKDIGEKIGYTEQRLRQIVELAALPEDAKAMIRTGQVAATLAGTILRANDLDGEKTMEVLTEAVETANAMGKVRATAKHLSRSVRKVKVDPLFKEVFEAAIAVPEHENEKDGTSPIVGYTLSLSAEDFERIRGPLNIHVATGAKG